MIKYSIKLDYPGIIGFVEEPGNCGWLQADDLPAPNHMEHELQGLTGLYDSMWGHYLDCGDLPTPQEKQAFYMLYKEVIPRLKTELSSVGWVLTSEVDDPLFLLSDNPQV